MKIFSILKRELVDGLRDRRALGAALSFALIGPVLIVLMINVMAAAGREGAAAPFRLCGAGTAPDLVAHLTAAGLVLADSADICIDVPGDYSQRLAAGETAAVRVVADLTAAGPTTEKIEREIGRFSRVLGAQRLMARGVSPGVAAPIRVEMHSTNRVARLTSAMGAILILYIAFAPFIVVFAMAADTSAGERERRSLESLLSHPLGALDVIAGKFLALAAVNLAGLAACIALSLVLVDRSAAAELGLRIDTSLAAGFQVFVWLTPLTLLVTAVQLALGFYSKTAKEAQQTSMLVSMLPLMVGMMFTMRQSLNPGAWPLAWELKALAGPLLGSTSAVAPFPLVAGVELAAAALILLASARRVRSESVLG
jgi:sodium transport system permease protein